MRLLLDTHIFLWYISGDAKLPHPHRDAIRDGGNEVFLSVVSIWEIIVKHQLGRLPLPHSPQSYLPAARARHGFTSLPLDERSVVELNALPSHHRDPFDRMLICQAISHDLQFLSTDALVQQYQASNFSLLPP